MMHMMVLWLAMADGGAADAGAADGSVADAGATDTYRPANPATWRLSAKLGKATPLREALLGELTQARREAGGGAGETPLTRAEAEAILDDSRAELIYGEKTVSIVAPSMVHRHRQEHVDLMKRFLLPERIEAGAKFSKDKEATLGATMKRTGVDAQVIVAILMWESKLGTVTGDYFAFNALASQAFFVDEANEVALSQDAEKALLSGGGKKSKKPTPEELAKLAEVKAEAEKAQQRRVETIRNRARKNLVVLLRQCKTRGIDPLSVKGSWAGALGFPQFMPASLVWAEDGNADGKIDLFNMDDAIASVGRYLAAAGFKRSARDAVYDYNHEEAYVQGVLAYAAALKSYQERDGGQ